MRKLGLLAGISICVVTGLGFILSKLGCKKRYMPCEFPEDW